MKTKMISLYPSRLWILSILLLGLLPVFLNAVPVISFNVTNLRADISTANWVFDYDNFIMNTSDGNAYSFDPAPAYLYHNYAHKYVHSVNGVTQSPCVSTTIAGANINDITIEYGQFELVAYEKINTVNPASAWNIVGQSGDRRTYSTPDGVASTVKLAGDSKLVLNKVTFVIDTPYPTQAQFRAKGGPFAIWTGDLGTGLPQTGYGFADINVGASDPTWVARFATNDNKMDLELTSIVYDLLLPSQDGEFDFILNLIPVAVPYTSAVEVVSAGNLNPTYPAQNLAMTFDSYVPGGAAGDEADVFVRELLAAPTGALPGGINFVAQKYWELGTTLNSLSTDITFTLNNGDFGKATTDWRILHREYTGAPWTVWPDYTLVDPTHIRANNVNTFSEFTVGSNVDETLPVELSSFDAILTADYFVNLAWVTESESQLLGFNVYRSETEAMDEASRVNLILIPAANTTQQQNYSILDDEVEANTTYYYWLESVGMGSGNTMFGPQSVTVTGNHTPAVTDLSLLGSAYPNPFRTGDNASINVTVKTGEVGLVTIYNLLGQTVKSYNVTAGTQTLTWDGKGCGSGVYFYKLSTPSTNATKRLVLMK